MLACLTRACNSVNLDLFRLRCTYAYNQHQLYPPIIIFFFVISFMDKVHDYLLTYASGFHFSSCSVRRWPQSRATAARARDLSGHRRLSQHLPYLPKTTRDTPPPAKLHRNAHNQNKTPRGPPISKGIYPVVARLPRCPLAAPLKRKQHYRSGPCRHG